MQHHYCPSVVNIAKIFDASNAPKSDLLLEEVLVHSYESMFEKELSWRKQQKSPLNIEKSSTLFEKQSVFSVFSM